MKKKVIISVTSDLVTDQRVHKVSETLHNNGYEVLLVGRKLKNSLPLAERSYKTKRFSLWFHTSALFYMNYNIRLFFFLLFTKTDILLSNDLDTLLANFMVASLKNKPLVYDSHEYFTGVPELQQRHTIRKIWEKIEGYIFPRLRYIYTVNDSIAALYGEKYQKEVKVVRNVPRYQASEVCLSYPAGKRILIYQGSGINVNRGAEELIIAMKFLDPSTYQLLLVGGGDVFESLKLLATNEQLDDRIEFINKVPFSQLQQITRQAHLGISFDKPTNLNYLNSLPNKIFDYLHAGLPILTSRLPEISRVQEKFNVGDFIEHHQPEHIAERIGYIFSDKNRYEEWKKNTKIASAAYCWQKEEQAILDIFNEISKNG